MTKPGYCAGLMACLLISVFFTACKRTDIQFGEDFIDNNYTKIIKVDSFSVNVSTVFLDSFATSGSGTGVVGVYKDKDFGQIKASSYMQIAPPADADIYTNTSYDSTRLVLKLNRTWYGDTTKPVRVNIYRVTDDINLPESATQFYNTSSFNTGSSPIGGQTIYLRPNGIDSTVSIPISDALGSEWMTLLQNRNDDVKTTDNFLLYFKGIAITATGDDGIVFGFQDSAHIDLHYTKRDIAKTDMIAKFSMVNNGKQFNNINIDRSGTYLQGYNAASKEVSSTLTGNAGFVQSITGTRVKITVPYIRNLLNATGYVKISSATLQIRPVNGSFNYNAYKLPTALSLSQTDATNYVGSALTTSAGAAQTGDLIIDDLYGVDTRYTYDLTTFLQTQIAISETNKNGLLLHLPTNEYTTFSRLVVGNQQQKTGNIQLYIYYISVQ